MKTIKNIKVFDAVAYMCQQREKLSEKLSKMTKMEIIEYFAQIKEKSVIKPYVQQEL